MTGMSLNNTGGSTAGAWIVQRRDDLKGDEVFNSDDTRGDFANARLAIAGRASNLDGKVKGSDGRINDLTTRLENSVPRLAANATQEQTAAFRRQFAEPKRWASRNYRQRTDGIESRAQMTAGVHDAVYAANLPEGEGSRARARTECLCFLSRHPGAGRGPGSL